MRFGFIIIVLLTTGCVSLEVPISGNRFITPEVSGELGKGKLGGSVYSTTNIVLMRDMDADPKDTSHPDLRSGSALGINGTLGVWDRIDLQLDSALGLGAIVQVVGNPANSAQSKDWSLAIHSHLGRSVEEKSVDSSLRSYTVAGKAKNLDWDYGAVLGYRADESTLPYIGISESRIRASGEVVKKDKSSGAETTFIIEEANGVSRAINLGVHFGSAQGFYATLETGYMHTIWPNTESFGRTVYGIRMGGAW